MLDPLHHRTGSLGRWITHHTCAALAMVLLARVTHANEFFHTRGVDIVDPSTNESYHSRGIVLSGWLLAEAYGLRFDAVHDRHINAESDMKANIVRLLGDQQDDADAFWEAFTNNFVTEDDIAEFARLGFNSVRIPFNYRLLSPEDTPGEYDEAGFVWLDTAIQWCKNHGLSVLLDMHACPGGQSHDAYADPEYRYWNKPEGSSEYVERGVQVMFEDNAEYFEKTGRTAASNQQRTADIWRTIADRYKDEEAILGYELANEPYYYETSGVTDDDLRNFFILVTAAVREVDTNHIVFVEGNIFAEMIHGLLPPFDSNMAIAVHRYWRETGYEDGAVQEYLDAREEHQVPFLVTESGENSNPWIYELTQLLESNRIGYFYWGFKKVDAISTTYNVEKSEAYQYVIDNWRDSEFDPVLIKEGLMDLAEAVKTEHCTVQPGFFAAMLDPLFNVTPQPFMEHSVPGTIQAVHYDIGNNGVAYSDTRYKVVEYQGPAWNDGWTYRNDGVDIFASSDGSSGTDYYVSSIEANEWMKFTVTVPTDAYFTASVRARSNNSQGQVQIFRDNDALTEIITIEDTSGQWSHFDFNAQFRLDSGLQILKVHMVEGGFDFASFEVKVDYSLSGAESPSFQVPSAAPELPNSFIELLMSYIWRLFQQAFRR